MLPAHISSIMVECHGHFLPFILKRVSFEAKSMTKPPTFVRTHCGQSGLLQCKLTVLFSFSLHVTANDPGRIIVIKDLSNIVPLKKQQSFLAMASQILNMLGEKMVASSFHSHILQIILSLLSSCVFALEQRHKVKT